MGWEWRENNREKVLQRIKVESLNAYRRHCVGVLYKRGLIRSKVFAVDGSGIGSEMRVVGLMCMQKDGPLWVNWRLRTGTESEKGKEGQVLLEMVDEVREIAGADAIEWVLLLLALSPFYRSKNWSSCSVAQHRNSLSSVVMVYAENKHETTISICLSWQFLM